MRAQKTIDMKHSMRVDIQLDLNGHVATVELLLVKHENDTIIPDTEPTILFRGRDKFALPMLNFYKRLCEADGATTHQLTSIQTMIDKFGQFSVDNPQSMKQPGVTLGK